MKKVRITLPSVLILFMFFFVARVNAATTPSPSPTTSPTSTSSSSVNPGPPLGTPCGKTMCLPSEVCATYPGDIFPHCVPNPLVPGLTNPKPFCAIGTGTFPPNIACINNFINAQTELDLYKKTCIYEPVVTYGDKRRLNAGIQSFSKCGIGDSGPGGPPAPGGNDPVCDVHMLANTDVRDAELGGYGPSESIIKDYSIDFISQNYLYDSLFDRPLDLSDKNREAYRTYWRLMPAANQANLRSYVMNMADQKLINDIKYTFTDVDGSQKTTSFKALYDALKTQVILFWHFPFLRIGCLTSYPVCPEYAQAQRELKPIWDDLTNLANQLNLGSVASVPIGIFRAAFSAFSGDLNGPYDAFVPLEFDSVRGYILKKKDDTEQEAYNQHPELRDFVNAPRYGTPEVKLSNVSRESLPYIGAIYQGLLSPKFGMIPALQAQWIIDKYATPEGEIISDYKMGNSPATLPEVKIAHKSFLETAAEELEGMTTDPIAWILNKISSAITSLFSPSEVKKEGYTALNKDNENGVILPQYVNMKNCPMPVSYHLLSPKTKPISPDDHHQVVTIPGNQLEWSYTPQCHSMEPKYECSTNKSGQEKCGWVIPKCSLSAETYIDPGSGECCTRAWSVSGTKHGKALTVLNNPKQTDIKKAVASENSIALYPMLLPDGAKKIPNAEIDAPIAKNTKTTGDALSTAPNGKGDVTNPAESIMRENNLAQDSIHFIQNCWTIPQELQNSPRCKYAFGGATASSSACTGQIFAQIVPNPDEPSSKATDYFESWIKSRLTPELIEAYTAAEAATGVPCEVFAGIHFEEGDNDPNKSLQDGSPLNGKSLTESAIQAGQELLAKAGGTITDLNTLMMAMSYYNGGGNANCQPSADCSYTSNDRCGAAVACYTTESGCTCTNPLPEPGSCRDKCGGTFAFKFDYSYCPPASIGYDDPYVTNWWKSPEHDTMYLLYMRDCTQTRPRVHSRPGSLTVAISLFLSEQGTK